MSAIVLILALSLSQFLLVVARGCAGYRMGRGPRAQDRVLGLDALYAAGMMLLLTLGIRSGFTIYFEMALVIALLGFVSTAALAKFLMRGEVIE